MSSFNPAYPEGMYSLNLGSPAERVIASQLCRLDQISATDLAKGILLAGKPTGGSVKRLKWPARCAVRAPAYRLIAHKPPQTLQIQLDMEGQGTPLPGLANCRDR